MSNKITIPWYSKRIKKPANLVNEPSFNFDLPEFDKKKRGTRTRPQPNPIPQLNPEPIKITEDVLNPNTTNELANINTPIPVIVPVPRLNGENRPLPTYDGDGRTNPKTPIPNWREQIPSFNRPDVITPIRMPAGDILFKLMESEPSGKYNNFINNYNDFTLNLAWNIANPYIIHSKPSFEQVKTFLENHNYNEVTGSDIRKYFSELGVKGKDLTSLPARIYLFKTTIDTLNAIEQIVVPPIPDKRVDEL